MLSLLIEHEGRGYASGATVGFNRQTTDHVHFPNCSLNRVRSASPSAWLCTIANTVDPEPAISANKGSDCSFNQSFSNARNKYFGKTAGSRSFRNFPHGVTLSLPRFKFSANRAYAR